MKRKYTIWLLWKLFQLIAILSIMTYCVFSGEIVKIDSKFFGIDKEKKLIIINQNINDLKLSIYTSIKGLFLDNYYSFQNSNTQIQYGKKYNVLCEKDNELYSLFFIDLPLIYINTDNTIVDEPEVSAVFRIVESNGNTYCSNIGIEYRGGSTIWAPKKSYKIEFWEDNSGQNTKNVSLLNMREDDDINLQAMYIERIRIRSKTSNQLWNQIHSLYYQDKEPEAKPGIDMKYAELFVNNEYKGIFCVAEKIDRKQLKLKKFDKEIRGELYFTDDWGKRVVCFDTIYPFNSDSIFWDGFEYKHPEEQIDWTTLYDFVDFVVNSKDDSFYKNYMQFLNTDNAVDYLIFVNLLRANDNIGKNIFIAKYDINEPYFLIPWDLDATFGIDWEGKKEYITDGFLSNGLFRRLWHDCSQNGFREKIKKRWNELKTNILSYDNIMSLFKSNYYQLKSNAVFERESIVYDFYSLNSEDEFNYIENWVAQRLVYLNNAFNEDCIGTNVIDDELNTINLYPNPANNILYINNINHEILLVNIHNINGELVLKTCLNENNNTIDISKLNNGVYFLQISGSKMYKINKLIINR